MQHKIYLSPLALSLAVAVSSPLQAAEALPLQTMAFTQLQNAFRLDLPNTPHVTPHAMRVSVDALQFVKQHTDKKNITHVRMQQMYAGFPVFGGYAVLHSKNATKTLLQSAGSVRMNGTVYRSLEADLGKPAPSFVDGASAALQQFRAHYTTQTILEEQVTPMVYMNAQHRAFWAYKVSVLVQPENGIPERPTAIIDAQTFVPFERWDDIKTNRSIVKGQGYGGNQRMGTHQYGVDLPFLELSRDDAKGLCYMKNKDVSVVDMGHDYVMPLTAMTFNCATNYADDNNTYWTGYLADGYDRINQADSPTNDALYIGSIIKKMYSEWYGFDVLTRENAAMRLVMRVHYGQGYENAFWDGKQMTFGDGDSRMYPLVSMGVGAHEISHGFTEQHSDLNYIGQSGGMNEAFSDMASQAAVFYAKGECTWDIGSDIMKLSSGYKVLRYLDVPSRDGRSIDRASQYRPGMDVHFSSGVYNRLFYLLATQPGWDVRQAFHVMVKANVDYWTPYTDFQQGACGVISAAQDLELSVESVKQALDGVSIDYRACVE